MARLGARYARHARAREDGARRVVFGVFLKLSRWKFGGGRREGGASGGSNGSESSRVCRVGPRIGGGRGGVVGWKGRFTGRAAGAGHDGSFISSAAGTSTDQVGLEDLEHSLFPRACGVWEQGRNSKVGAGLAVMDQG